MPFFKRREEPRLPRHVRRSRRESSQATRIVQEPLSTKRRPTFLQWLKLSAWDILTLLVLAAIAFSIFRQPPAGTRTFPVTFQQDFSRNQPSLGAPQLAGSGDVVWPQYAYPYRDQIISSNLDTGLALGVPVAVIILAQVRVWSFWDLNNGIFGVIQAVLSGTVFQVALKWLIGGLRPNFYDVCKPDTSLAYRPGGNSSGLEGTGFGGIFYTRAICTGGNEDGISNSLESFPSGHTNAAFAGGVFLFLYLNAKLKVFSNHQPRMWKLAVTWAPLLGATLIAGSLTVDQSHNWYDLVAGGIIGTMMAFFSFRTMYASVFDWRVNHIPLHRHQPFVSPDDGIGADWMITRAAGWGSGGRRSVRKKVEALVGRGGGHEKETSHGSQVPVAEAGTRRSVSPRDNGGNIQSPTSGAYPSPTMPRRAVGASSDNDRYGHRARPVEDMV